MTGSQQCFFCGGRATLEPRSGVNVCHGCTLRVADLAADPSEGIWSNAGAPKRGASASPEAVKKADVDQVFEAFKEGVAKQISEKDGDSHLHLAEAYSELGST